MPVRRSAKTPTIASYEFFFKKPPVSAKNQRNIVLTRPVETKNQKLFGGVAKDSYLCRGFRGTSRKAAGKDAAGGDMRK